MTLTTKILGDVHLGRRFIRNVPLHRRGERERMIREQFIQELDPKGADLHICLGDLFDAQVVDFDTILFAAHAYRRAAEENHSTEFIILRGNHDAGRDLTVTTAFDIFSAIMDEDITIVDGWMKRGEHIFFGWNAGISAEDIVKEAGATGATIAYGHWDTDLRSHTHNLIPTALLAEQGITKAYTGHVHLADTFTRDGVEVIVHGSMTGLAHGEGHPYVTLTPDELAKMDVTNLCVRIRGSVDEIPNCLQWQVEKPEAAEADIDVTMEEFDLTKVYEDAFEGLDVSKTVRGAIDTKWQETFMRQG